MKLRTQIYDIAIRWIGGSFVDHISFPMIVDYLAAKAFDCGLVPSSNRDTRAVFKARRLMRHPGWVSDEEEGVE